MLLRLELDRSTAVRLVECAVAESRPIPMQAQVLIRRALGLPFPYPTSGDVVGESCEGTTSITLPMSGEEERHA
jgi:hypothetical protein